MPVNDRREFEVDGTTYAVRIPKVQDIKEANELRSRTFNEALSRGDLLRDQLESELRKRSLWNDNREMEYQTLRKEVLDGEYRLEKGGIKLKQAKDVAIDMSEKRAKMVDLLSSRTDLDSNTCEGKADAARFNFLFACCLVYDEDDTPYFPNKLDDYLENQDDPVALQGANEYYYLISGSDSFDSNLPEHVFLKKFKFTDDQNRLIDNEGRLIDQEGKHIDENGLYIKWSKDGTSTSVDANGRKVNDEGRFQVKSSPFLDDDGSPIDDSKYEEAKPKAKKRKTKAKKTVKVVAEEDAETEVEEVEAVAEEAEAEEAEVS
tara:strand:- start:3057 stop:4013 length:957 start_codon:yes stop_codon:yes gene_type:complete